MGPVAVPVFVIDHSGRVVFRNDEWLRYFGDAGTGPWSWLSRLPDDEPSYVRRALERAAGTRQPVELEFDVRRRDGSLSVLACAASPVTVDGDDDLILLVCWDLTDRRHNEERLAFMAGHDPLTGLANRRAFDEALARAASIAQRGRESSLLLIDLDNLKRFNDSRGHLEGDQALINLAMLLRTQVRAGDLPARIGGDEFAVLLEGTGIEEAREIADRIRRATATEEFVAGAREHGLGISGGIAVIEPGVDPRLAFDRADEALYSAKESGRDRIVVWDARSCAPGAPERFANRVRAAFAEDRFHLVFQPIVRLSDQSVVYFESFMRMRDEDGSTLSPREFLPVVERLGLNAQLTRRAVDLALWQLASTPGTALSVNLAPSDIADEELLTDLESMLGAATSAYGRLLFEMSESTLLSNITPGRMWLDRLSKCGCRFVLDDFGTGTGMFMLLRERHIEHVKLSRSAMGAMSGSDESRAFVRAVRELIESQGKAAVASYIETQRLLGEAEQAGFVYGQGYGLSEPEGDLASLAARFGAGE